MGWYLPQPRFNVDVLRGAARFGCRRDPAWLDPIVRRLATWDDEAVGLLGSLFAEGVGQEADFRAWSIRLVAALERRCNEPISECIVEWAREERSAGSAIWKQRDAAGPEPWLQHVAVLELLRLSPDCPWIDDFVWLDLMSIGRDTARAVLAKEQPEDALWARTSSSVYQPVPGPTSSTVIVGSKPNNESVSTG